MSANLLKKLKNYATVNEMMAKIIIFVTDAVETSILQIDCFEIKVK